MTKKDLARQLREHVLEKCSHFNPDDVDIPDTMMVEVFARCREHDNLQISRRELGRIIAESKSAKHFLNLLKIAIYCPEMKH